MGCYNDMACLFSRPNFRVRPHVPCLFFSVGRGGGGGEHAYCKREIIIEPLVAESTIVHVNLSVILLMTRLKTGHFFFMVIDRSFIVFFVLLLVSSLLKIGSPYESFLLGLRHIVSTFLRIGGGCPLNLLFWLAQLVSRYVIMNLGNLGFQALFLPRFHLLLFASSSAAVHWKFGTGTFLEEPVRKSPVSKGSCGNRFRHAGCFWGFPSSMNAAFGRNVSRSCRSFKALVRFRADALTHGGFFKCARFATGY